MSSTTETVEINRDTVDTVLTYIRTLEGKLIDHFHQIDPYGNVYGDVIGAQPKAVQALKDIMSGRLRLSNKGIDPLMLYRETAPTVETKSNGEVVRHD